MNELVRRFIIGSVLSIGLLIVFSSDKKPSSNIALSQDKTPQQTTIQATEEIDNQTNQRILKLSIDVENTSFLKVKEGDAIKAGDIITDNSIERNRLDKQRQSLQLQIDNLKAKNIPQPFQPKTPPQLAPLPPANFAEEESAIAQAKLKLQQAQGILESRYKLLQSDDPEVRAETDKAEAGLRIASEKVREQEELIRLMQDMKLDPPVLRHEEAVLKQLTTEMEQSRSILDQAKAKLNSKAIAGQQELQSLQIAVQIAQSDLQMALSRLETAKSNRKLLEYRASIEAAQRVEQENQASLSYTRQQQDYAQQIRDRDYQLAQLQISLTNVDDKLSQIPVVKSPKTGYIRKIRPWVGKNGKYSTVVTISSSPKSSNDVPGSGGR